MGEHETFQQRLEWLAQGRLMTPWLKGLGWSNGDVSRVSIGHIPGPAKLISLAVSENVNLSWLLANLGDPYLPKPSAGEVQEARARYPIRVTTRQQMIEMLPDLPDEEVKELIRMARFMKRKRLPGARR